MGIVQAMMNAKTRASTAIYTIPTTPHSTFHPYNTPTKTLSVKRDGQCLSMQAGRSQYNET